MIIALTEHVDIQKLLTDVENSYASEKGLIVKKKEDVIIIKYNKNNLTKDNIHSLGLFRSVIIDNNGRILSFSPPKSIPYYQFIEENNLDDCIIEPIIEGTMINVFWDYTINDWNISTKSTVGARCVFNIEDGKTFRYMFLDIMNTIGLEFEHLNPQLVYSFVMKHPLNRIVVPVDKCNLTLIAVYSIKNNEIQIINDLNSFIHNCYDIIKPYKDDNKYTEFVDIYEHFSSDNMPYIFPGIVIKNKLTGARTKIRNSNYERVRHLKGNTPKMQYHYYYLRQNGLVKDFLKYYPEYRQKFSEHRSILHSWTNTLYQNYVDCFIKKLKPLREFPYNFKTHMYKLHELYLNKYMPEKKYITRNAVIEYVNTLPPPRLMYSVNHIFKEHEVDLKKEKIMVN